jgi:hypothetical protein
VAWTFDPVAGENESIVAGPSGTTNGTLMEREDPDTSLLLPTIFNVCMPAGVKTDGTMYMLNEPDVLVGLVLNDTEQLNGIELPNDMEIDDVIVIVGTFVIMIDDVICGKATVMAEDADIEKSGVPAEAAGWLGYVSVLIKKSCVGTMSKYMGV